MAPLPSRKSLESMKRVDLQRLCKDYGVKANLKSEALIDLLIGTANPRSSAPSSRRSVSTRHATRATSSHINDVVMHDAEKDAEDEQNVEIVEGHAYETVNHEPTPPLATRTRKKKEQTMLGVGRPLSAGGTGPRAVTKSTSLTRSKRGKGSRTVQTIREEVELEPTIQPATDDKSVILEDDRSLQTQGKSLIPEASIDSLATVDQRVADAIRPLHEQIKSMKSELELMQALKAEVGQLKTRIDEIDKVKEQLEALTATIRDLPKDADEISAQATSTSIPSTPKMQSTESRRDLSVFLPAPGTVSRHGPSLAVIPDSPTVLQHPGIAPHILGKRHRDSLASELLENDQESGIAFANVMSGEKRPSRKRTKLSVEIEDQMKRDVTPQPLVEGASLEEIEGGEFPFRGSNFEVFSGLDVSSADLTDPPPTKTLPDYFAPSPPSTSETVGLTSTSNAIENRQPFTFTFQHPPLSSTPAHYMPSFPYPEPPQSPSPAGNNPTNLQPRQTSRSDVFQTFGFPPPGRSSRLRSSGFIDPASLTGQLNNNGESSQAVGGLIEADTSTAFGINEASSSHMKRTMYGTELDGDTRFGDFGLEGVGTGKGGFWAGGRF
ncbi:hypothetical protein H0H93_013926 [Arthromyces matolae]|nr:hypothetical protein H0H93_013926 [Arthromyces matolae]